MCGLAGVILETKRRRKTELAEIGRIFTELLLLNQSRGKDAAGLAMIRRDGTYSLFKRPGPAAKLAMEEKYSEIIGRLNNRTICILGHTRLKTRGSEANSANNHPIRAGGVIGTATGTILNADDLFRKFRLTRHAEVDSEFLFRLADRRNDVERFITNLKHVRGTMTAVFTKTTAPEQIHVIKGNKPLAMWYHREYRAVFYSSEQWPLETVFGDDGAVVPLDIAPFTLVSFDVRNLMSHEVRDIQFKGRRDIVWKRFNTSVWSDCLSMEHS